ncbi:hypothetical protein PPYR_11125 [Photinus pyralis]|uniref:Hemolymph juvenile hormone-binding protein n=2 Tax=Photinus pyralis TaxID=7054 RepID=A0A5N4AAC7_PHOPY|nr:uncharacterized protein LOC116177030 isoform X2 [Photinus pyralis]KAB0794286.1 hypothetical protein PPYR_11125 [Photinus pyralis]
MMLVDNLNRSKASYIKVCHRDDPKLSNCINDSITILKPYLKKGIPELDVPPLEPLLLDAVDLKSGNDATRIEATLSNLEIWGPTSFIILELKPNLNKNVFKFKVLLPELNVVGRYKADARVLFFNLKGEGPAFINITNYKFECKLKGNKISKGGEEFLEFEKMRLKIEVGTSSIRLENLFNGDPVLGKATSDVVNENSNLFISEILPNLQQALSEKFTNIANKITLRFTHKELFPY